MSVHTEPLVLTARLESQNSRHAQIGVFQKGAKAGVLTVETAQAGTVLAVFNSHDALLEALRELVDSPNAKANDAWDKARAAIALAEGAQP